MKIDGLSASSQRLSYFQTFYLWNKKVGSQLQIGLFWGLTAYKVWESFTLRVHLVPLELPLKDPWGSTDPTLVTDALNVPRQKGLNCVDQGFPNLGSGPQVGSPKLFCGVPR